MAPELEIRAFPGAGDPSRLLPPASEQSAPFWDALAGGRLIAQACGRCGRPRHPIAPVCPYCAATQFDWRTLNGAGTVHSWALYRRSYLPEFEPLMPYAVLCVTLEAGPRMFGRLVDGKPEIGMRVQAIVERFAGGGYAIAFDG